MIVKLIKKLLKLELYITDGYRELTDFESNSSRKIEDVGMYDYIRICSY